MPCQDNIVSYLVDDVSASNNDGFLGGNESYYYSFLGGPGGTALDLSEAQLQGGCEFAVRFSGAAKRIVYPAGVAKLAGNTLTIDGVLQ